MDVQIISLLIQGGVGITALVILWQYMQNVASDNKRKDDTIKFDRETSQQNHREFMLLYGQSNALLAGLMGKQTETAAAVVTAGTRVITHAEGETEKILIAMQKAQDLIAEVLTILVSDTTRLPRFDPALELLRKKEEAQKAAAEAVEAVDAIPAAPASDVQLKTGTEG